MKNNTKKIIVAVIIIAIIIIGAVFIKIKRNSDISKAKAKAEESNEEKVIEATVEDYKGMDTIILKNTIDSKEEEIQKTNEEIAMLNDEYSSLNEQLRELSQEEAEKFESEINEGNKTTDKSASEITIEEGDSDEVKIEKLKEKMVALHAQIEKQNLYLEEQTKDISNAYEAYAEQSVAK